MNIVIFGATGGVGRAVLKEALAVGHHVRVYTRGAAALPEAVERVEGQLDDGAAMARALAGRDAVISALGPRSRADIETVAKGVETLVAAMQASAVRRLVAISGAAVTTPTDKKNLFDRLLARFVDVVAHGMVEEKQRELVTISGSSLDWTIVRPPGLVDRPSKGPARTGIDRPIGMSITYTDLARFMVAQLEDLTWLRQAPFIAN